MTAPEPFAVQLSVVIPAYLEEENLRLILPRLATVLASLGVRHEILVIDRTRAHDATEQVCRETGARYVNRAPGDSYGDAVRTGLAAALGESVVFMDADGSHAPEFVPTLFAARAGQDVVIASRYVAGGETDNRPYLILLSRFVNLAYSVVLGLNVKDVSNSFKLYAGDQARVLTLTSDNFDIIEELLYKMKKANPKIRILEVPFSFKERMFGHTKRNLIAFALSYLVTLIRLRLS